MRLTHEYTSDIENRFKIIIGLFIIFFIIVFIRLYYLQILKGNLYRFFSTENSIKQIVVRAPRGIITDKNDNVLVDNRPSFDIVVVPQYVHDSSKSLMTISKYLNIPIEELNKSWEKRKRGPSYKPIILKKDASRDEVALIRSRKGTWYEQDPDDDFTGIEVQVNYQRYYPNGSLITHVLGYIREIDKERLERYQETYPSRYQLGDNVGVRGLEEIWDLYLRGEDGYEQLIVNAVGREVDFAGISDQLEKKQAVVGDNLKLTIDKDVQEIAQKFFDPAYAGGESPVSLNKKGAAVVIDVNTGGIVAMYSSPSYDLNTLVDNDGSNYWNEISRDPRGYLINRAIQGAYPPGSTFKVVTALAGLSEKVITPDTHVTCNGALFFGGRPFHCWKRAGHGSISLFRSISHSCDVFYYRLGLKLGVDKISEYAKYLGLGEKTGISLRNERPGLMPSSEWKLKRFGVPWQQGETLSTSVGQSYDLVTPLQNALVAAQIANGGKKLFPHFVQSIYDVKGKEIYKWKDEKHEEIPIPKDVIEFVRKAMIGTVADGGTANRLSKYNVTMGGKTGTAQVVSLKKSESCKDDKCRDHAWFIGFAPAENPEVAAAVIVEHGGFGATAAAPIVGAMLQKYFDSKTSEIKNLSSP